MAYLGIALIVLLFSLIQRLDDKITTYQNEKFEEMHKSAYDWINEHTDNPAVARERKAEIDLLINSVAESSGRKYKPKDLKQVSSKKERAERVKASSNGERYISDDFAQWAIVRDSLDEPSDEIRWAYSTHTKEERREHFIQTIMSELCIPRELAEKKADKFY